MRRLRLPGAASRAAVGWALAVLGAVALFLAWYGVSGTPVTAKQVPYVVSGGLAGVALVVLASALLAGDDVRRQVDRLASLERKVDTLYGLFVEEGSPADAPAAGTGPVALPAGESFHRAECLLVRGKPAEPVDAAAITARGLAPCPVCGPLRAAS